MVMRTCIRIASNKIGIGLFLLRRGMSATTSVGLTHVDAVSGQPSMVDVSAKLVTTRVATASARIELPPDVFALVQQSEAEEETGVEIASNKGPVLATAIIAGTMGAKRAADLIPFCHPLPVESVKIAITVHDQHAYSLAVCCSVTTTGKTGVEMEALTGASVAALTVYDMLKAASQDIVVADLRLEGKSGGKTDFDRANGNAAC